MRVVPLCLAFLLAGASTSLRAEPAARAPAFAERNPVWVSKDNLRDPSVLKVEDGYWLFYSRLAGDWSKAESWTIAATFTRDFITFENNHDISPKNHASPGDVVRWHGRYVLPYQSYPVKPQKLCFATSDDLKTWSEPTLFLTDALALPWNGHHRLIDPTLVVDGDTLHCFFIASADMPFPGGKKRKANLMGHAITRDPALQKWDILTKDAPLMGQSERAPDGVENTMVFKTGDEWTMIFSEGLEKQHLAIATSKDLIAWTIKGPINLPRQKWMANKYGAPFVWRDGDIWRMILMGEDANKRTTFGLLSSRDGREWQLLPE